MTARLHDVTIIRDGSGAPVSVVMSYDDFLVLSKEESAVPPVVRRAVVGGESPVRAWREYLGLSQCDMAKRLGITQPGYAQHEAKPFIRLSQRIRERIASALGIGLDQLAC